METVGNHEKADMKKQIWKTQVVIGYVDMEKGGIHGRRR